MSELAKLTNEDFSREKIELIKSLVAKDCSDDELQLFLYTCKKTGLDPLARQIYAIKRGGKMTIQTGIDGYRVIADRTGRLSGISDYVFDSEEGKNPKKATVTVKKIVGHVAEAEFTATARWEEYNAGGPMWAKMPYLMLGKCAEALALRKAFPADLSGVYTAEEMAQADNPERDQVFAEVERQKSNVGRSSVLDAEPKTGDIQKPSEAKATLTMEGRTGTANAPTETIPPELDWSYNKASGVLICRVVDVKVAKTKGAKPKEYVAVKINQQIDGKDMAFYWHESHKAELLAAKGKICKFLTLFTDKGFLNIDMVLGVDGRLMTKDQPESVLGDKPLGDPETQARLLGSVLSFDDEDLREVHAHHNGDWAKVVAHLKDLKQRKDEEGSAMG